MASLVGSVDIVVIVDVVMIVFVVVLLLFSDEDFSTNDEICKIYG